MYAGSKSQLGVPAGGSANLLAAPTNAASSSNPPVKVPLRRGRSLMDWVKLGNSGTDLAGTDGKPLRVDEHMMLKHSTKHSAWTVINGDVYNISAYCEYHPGGEEELLRAAGTDATALFNQIHPWVNYQSMLQRCLVGRFVGRLSAR